uniref:Vacuolar protein sorting-associated protein 33A n=1 Tax=Timema douglasi TaxID=61478 RepID=A0A7R8VDZ1_TIMDO|nr:unnamed protein product [Timema douglasi]
MASHLSGGKVNVALVQDEYKKDLLRLLSKCEGSKAIVWDKGLAGPVGLIAKLDLLRDNEVMKMFPMTGDRLPTEVVKIKNLIFISRPKLSLMDLVAKHIHWEEQSSTNKREFHLFFVPRRSKVCEKFLMTKGVFGTLTFIEEFACNLYPFDSDLMSMELEDAYKEYHFENDPTCLYQVAKAVMELQRLFGTIPAVYGKGAGAKHVCDLMRRMARERMGLEPPQPKIDRLLLLDRSVDLLTALATPLTYEGLIDEIFSINSTTAHFPAESSMPDSVASTHPPIPRFTKADEMPGDMPTQKKKIILNSADELFAEIRDKNFNAVGPTLSRKARLISSQFEERHGEKTVQEMKQFVARLPHMMAAKASLATHTTIAELIKELTDSDDFLESLQTEQEFMNGIDTDRVHPYIEDCIAQKHPLLKVLKLLCMQSITNSGMKAKVLDHYKREILQTYGFQHILTLRNLESVGLLRVQHSSRPYTILRKMLRLTVEDESEITPTDISYVHSVYAPLSVRLAQQLVSPGGWKGMQDILGLLPGPTVEETQLDKQGKDLVGTQPSQTEVVLVFFIGGCTYSEVSALRFLSQREDSNVEFVTSHAILIDTVNSDIETSPGCTTNVPADSDSRQTHINIVRLSSLEKLTKGQFHSQV